VLVAVLIGSYAGYKQYRRYRIMKSPAGQAIKQFLEVVNETDDQVPELEKPKPADQTPDDETILRPFDEIESVVED
jgi:hypothetical protein